MIHFFKNHSRFIHKKKLSSPALSTMTVICHGLETALFERCCVVVSGQAFSISVLSLWELAKCLFLCTLLS